MFCLRFQYQLSELNVFNTMQNQELESLDAEAVKQAVLKAIKNCNGSSDQD